MAEMMLDHMLHGQISKGILYKTKEIIIALRTSYQQHVPLAIWNSQVETVLGSSSDIHANLQWWQHSRHHESPTTPSLPLQAEEGGSPHPSPDRISQRHRKLTEIGEETESCWENCCLTCCHIFRTSSLEGCRCGAVRTPLTFHITSHLRSPQGDTEESDQVPINC